MFRNLVRRYWSGFQAVFMIENGVIDWRCGESAVCSTDLYMVFGVSELGLCVSELG